MGIEDLDWGEEGTEEPVLFGGEEAVTLNGGPLGVVFLPEGGEKEDLAQQMKDSVWDWRLPRQCVICGREFIPKTSRHRCCSDICWYRKRYRDRELHSRSEVRRCAWCGKKMLGGEPGFAWATKYCSRSCAATAKAYQTKKKGHLGFQLTAKKAAQKRWAGHTKLTEEEKRQRANEYHQKWRKAHPDKVKEQAHRAYLNRKAKEKANGIRESKT